MRMALQPRDKRALVGLAAAAAFYLLISYVILPFYDVLATAEQTALDKQAEVKKYRQVINRKDRYSELIGEVRRQMAAAETMIIRSDNPSLAAVELQTLVEAMAEKLELKLDQRNVSRPQQQRQASNEMTMTLSFQSRPEQLLSFLSELRSAPKSLKVSRLSVSSMEAASPNPKKGEIKKDMRVNMTIAAVIGTGSTTEKSQ